MSLERLALLAGCLAAASAARADVILYENDFQSDTPLNQWSGNAHRVGQANFSWFLGRYSQDDSVTLTLPAPGGIPEGKWAQFKVEFDLYCIDSWDGENAAEGKDYFQFIANGKYLLSDTFSNHIGGAQTYKGTPTKGPEHLGFNPSWLDSIYADMAFSFQDKSAQTLTLVWHSAGLLTMNDESWGIDNVKVSYTVVPAPGSVALAGLAGLIVARRRR